MAVLKLTKRTVDALEPAERPYLARDVDLKGFAVRVGRKGPVSWVVAYRPPPGGRGVPEKIYTLGALSKFTPDQARRAAAELLARVRLGADPAAERAEKRKALTLTEMLNLFDEQYLRTMVKQKTAVNNRIGLAELRRAYGGMKAETLGRAHIAALHTKMADRPYAANRALAVWARAFSWAGERGLVPEGHNPAKGLKRFREQGRERFLTTEELARLGDALRVESDPFAAAAIRLLILTGARLREILHSQWSQVDFERGAIFLADSKTGKKPIHLSAAAQAVLSGLPRVAGNPFIFAGKTPGQPRFDINGPWRRVCRAAGLEGVRLHDLRHSFASFGAGASLGLPIIGRLLGHTQSSTTQKYAHLADDPVKRAAETIGATIAAAMDGDKGAVIEIRKRQK